VSRARIRPHPRPRRWLVGGGDVRTVLKKSLVSLQMKKRRKRKENGKQTYHLGTKQRINSCLAPLRGCSGYRLRCGGKWKKKNRGREMQMHLKSPFCRRPSYWCGSGSGRPFVIT
jgi:hypothetical protein